LAGNSSAAAKSSKSLGVLNLRPIRRLSQWMKRDQRLAEIAFDGHFVYQIGIAFRSSTGLYIAKRNQLVPSRSVQVL
jgi:hypothetical protein